MATKTKTYGIDVLPEGNVASTLSLYGPTGSYAVTLKGPTGLSVDVSMVFPTGAGATGQALLSNGSGVMYWGDGPTGPTGAAGAAGSGGKVVQVVSATTSTQVSVATTTWTDTTLTATITPTSASNKVLVLIQQYVGFARSASAQGAGIRLLRGSTVIYTPAETATGPYLNYIGTGSGTAANYYANVGVQYVDSPSSTSATTYKTQGRPYLTSSSGTVTFQETDTVANGSSSIILMEIEP